VGGVGECGTWPVGGQLACCAPQLMFMLLSRELALQKACISSAEHGERVFIPAGETGHTSECYMLVATALLQFICERVPYYDSSVSKNGLEYLSYSTTVDYTGARATCTRVGGTLATIYSTVSCAVTLHHVLYVQTIRTHRFTGYQPRLGCASHVPGYHCQHICISSDRLPCHHCSSCDVTCVTGGELSCHLCHRLSGSSIRCLQCLVGGATACGCLPKVEQTSDRPFAQL
jgi:hypothetical protein